MLCIYAQMSYRKVGEVLITDKDHILGICHSEVIPNCICASLNFGSSFAVVKDGDKTKILYKEYFYDTFETVLVRDGHIEITNIFDIECGEDTMYVFSTRRGVRFIFDDCGKRISRRMVDIPRDAIGICMDDYVRCGNMLEGKHLTAYGRWYYVSSGILRSRYHTVHIGDVDGVYLDEECEGKYRVIYLSHGILHYIIGSGGKTAKGKLRGEWLSAPMWMMCSPHAIDKNHVLRDIRSAFDEVCSDYNNESLIHDSYSNSQNLYSDEPSSYEEGVISNTIGDLHGMRLATPKNVKSARKR